MKGAGYRCDICTASATVADDSGVPPEGWVVLSFAAANPFGPTFTDEAHACSWEHAAAIALERTGLADDVVAKGRG